jgi:dephospho-CoA kinase
VNFTKTILGLTGFYCSGKSTVEKYLKEKYGFFIIDVDKLGHEALEEKKDEVIKDFGREIINGELIDRKKLGSLVFGDKKKLAALNSIVHPWMINKTIDMISGTEKRKICINAALLFEMGLNDLCDRILIVKSSYFNIVQRGVKRDKNSLLKIIRILFMQKVNFLANKNRKSAEILYIANNSGLEQLLKNVDEIMTENV